MVTEKGESWMTSKKDDDGSGGSRNENGIEYAVT